MTRTYIVTGSASGIGHATATKLRSDGHRVIGVDLDDAEILGNTTKQTVPPVLYTTSKLSIARWVRRNASTAEWAESGIALNAVAPGTVRTPMTADRLRTREGLSSFTSSAPAPFGGPAADPSAIANLLAWLTSEENLYVTGQVIFTDGGAESIRRPEFV